VARRHCKGGRHEDHGRHGQQLQNSKE